jgi:phosphoribosylanthranilate isomerase
VLAGGLDADNISEAVRSVEPWGVDASSRLETGSGIKDPAKVAAFIREAKRT